MRLFPFSFPRVFILPPRGGIGVGMSNGVVSCVMVTDRARKGCTCRKLTIDTRGKVLPVCVVFSTIYCLHGTN